MTHGLPHLSRRRFLAASAALGAVTLPVVRMARANPKADYTLRAAMSEHRIAPDAPGPAQVWAYGAKVPGPVVRVGQGERLRVQFQNALEESSTIHWHGIRLPNAMDGVPGLTQPPVESGESFSYEFEPPDAGTFWYHPHVRSAVQVVRGLYGALIVEEKEPPRVDRDLVWVLDDWRLRDDGSVNDNFGHRHDLSHEGRMGNTVTVNGARLREFPVRAGERIRLRLVNTANARIFALRFDDLTPTVIALDGQPVAPHVPPDKRVVLGSGMRADVVVDMMGAPGTSSQVVDDYYEDDAYKFVTFVRSDQPTLRESPLDAPVALPANPLPEPDLASAQAQTVTIEGGAKGYLDEATYKGETWRLRKLWRKHRKIWTLNGTAAHSMSQAPMFTLTLGRTYRWTIRNDTAWEHPMHLHGHHFRVLSRNDAPVPHTPWADTVLLQADDSVEVAFVADNPGGWLFHCHILEHHEAGMGAVIKVA